MMRLSVLKLLPMLVLSGRGAFSDQAVTLTAAIIHLAGHPASLKLELRNNDAVPVSILTGVRADRSYPAANFSFFLHEANLAGPALLDCASCEPTMIDGSLGEFKITLGPGQKALVAIVPLSSFSYLDGARLQHLCTQPTGKTQLTIGLQGQSWPSVPRSEERYWTGTASATIPLTCKVESIPRSK